MKLIDIKHQSHKFIAKNFKYAFCLYGLAIIFDILYTVTFGSNAILAFTGSLLTTSAVLATIDIVRKDYQIDSEHLTSNELFKIFKNSKYITGFIGIGLLRIFWICLWSLLLLIPGIVKAIAYSQAFYIYRDHLDEGRSITWSQAITESRIVMNGHKGEYLYLNLSLIGWYFIACITFGLAYIYVAPYVGLVYAGYYDKVKNDYIGRNGSTKELLL